MSEEHRQMDRQIWGWILVVAFVWNALSLVTKLVNRNAAFQDFATFFVIFGALGAVWWWKFGRARRLSSSAEPE